MLNWKNSADYDFTDDLAPEGWAWEFLRRNPSYRSDFETVTNILLEFTEKYGNDRATWPKEEPAFKFTPPREHGETIKAWRARCAVGNGEPPHMVTVDRWYGEKWGLLGPIVPCSSLTATVRFSLPPEFGRLVEKVDDLEGLVDDIEIENGGGVTVFQDRVSVVVFDMRHSLPKQLKSIGKRLKRRQKALVAGGKIRVDGTKLHQTKWTRYLKVLDAKATGASLDEIGLLLGPGHADEYPDYLATHYAKDTLMQAEKLSNDGYKAILLMSG